MSDNIEYKHRKVRWQASCNVLNEVRLGKSDIEIAMKYDIKTEDVTKRIDGLIWLGLKVGTLGNEEAYDIKQLADDLNLSITEVEHRFNRTDARIGRV